MGSAWKVTLVIGTCNPALNCMVLNFGKQVRLWVQPETKGAATLLHNCRTDQGGLGMAGEPKCFEPAVWHFREGERS